MEVQEIAVGYIREHFMITATEFAAANQRLVDYAVSHDLNLTATFVERFETETAALGKGFKSAPQEFQRMLAELENTHAHIVIVPSLIHLAVVGNPDRVVNELAERGIAVRIAAPSTQ